MVGLNGSCPVWTSGGGLEIGPGLNRDPGSTAEGVAAASRAARASLSTCFSPNHVNSAQLQPTVSVAGSISGGGGGGSASIELNSDSSPSSDLHVFMWLARTHAAPRSHGGCGVSLSKGEMHATAHSGTPHLTRKKTPHSTRTRSSPPSTLLRLKTSKCRSVAAISRG